MACDRRNWRALLIPVCVVGLACTAGCLRSSQLRPAVEPVLEPQSSPEQEPKANERLIIPPSPGAPVSHATGAAAPDAGDASFATPLTSIATPALFEPGPTGLTSSSKSGTTVPPPPEPGSELTPSPTSRAASPGPGAAALSSVGAPGVSAQTPAVVAATQSPAAQSPAASATPLIDEAIQRVEALTRQQRESSSSADAVAEPDKNPARPSPGSASLLRARTAESDPPLPAGPAGSGETGGSTKATNLRAGSTPQSPPGPRPTRESSARLADPLANRSLANLPLSLRPSSREAKMGPRDPEGPPAELTQGPMPSAETIGSRRNPGAAPDVAAAMARSGRGREENSPLTVANVQLCSKVNGFGSCEPWAKATVHAGDRILLYCEMTGLQYEAINNGFISRLSTRVELRSAYRETVLWEQELGIARDICPRARHDYYVSYRLTLPRSLPAGPHRLRVVQTDLAANRSAYSEIPFTIAP
jgi:hypothetical protein